MLANTNTHTQHSVCNFESTGFNEIDIINSLVLLQILCYAQYFKTKISFSVLAQVVPFHFIQMYRIVKSVSCTIPLKSSTLNDFGLLYDKNMTERIYTSPQNRSKTCKHFLQFILKAKLFLSQFVLLTFVCRRKTWFTLFIYLFICIKCSLSWHCCRTVVMDMPIND